MKIDSIINQVVYSDCLKILSELPDDSVDFILTDPPYFIVEEVSVIRRSNKMKYKGGDLDFRKHTEWDRQWTSKQEYFEWFYDFLHEASRVLKEDRHIVIFCDKKDLSYIGYKAEEFGLKFRTPWFLLKTNPVPQGRKVSPMKSIEVAYWGTKGKSKEKYYNWQLGMIKDVVQCAIPQKEGSKERHPTQKPLYMALLLVAMLSKPGEIVLDPFAGSGTFLVAAKVLNRKFIGVEKDINYCQICQDRISNANSINYAIKIAKQVQEDLYKCKMKTIDNEIFERIFGLQQFLHSIGYLKLF